MLLTLKFLPMLRKYILDFLVAFGAGALIADPILHILPEVWGAGGHGGHADEDQPENQALWYG